MAFTALEREANSFSSRSEIAPATRRAYVDGLAPFLRWAETEGLEAPDELVPEVLERYARHLDAHRKKNGDPLATASRQMYLRALRQFLGFLSTRRGVQVDRAAVKLPKRRPVDRDVLTPGQAQQLEDAATSERDKLIVRVGFECGCRLGELVALRTDDLISRDRSFHFLRFRGKTGERKTPIPRALHARLVDHAAGKSGARPKSGNALFVTTRRDPQPRGGPDFVPLSERAVYQVVKDIAERSGIPLRIYPHLLRHSALTRMVASGMSPATISEITGVSIEVIVRHYLHQSDEQRYAAMAKLWDA